MMKRYSLSKKSTDEGGIAWHIRGIMDGGFYGEIRYDMPKYKKFNCKFVKGKFQSGDWETVVSLIDALEKDHGVSQDIRYWSILVARDTDGPEKYVKTIAGYFPGDETKTQVGKTYKKLLLLLEKYLKPFYVHVAPDT